MPEYPDFQDGKDFFWQMISPDTRILLERVEEVEDWVYLPEQLPLLFTEACKILMALAPTPPDARGSHLVADDLILMLASMPFRYAMYAMSWIEASCDSGLKWVSLIIARAQHNMKTNAPGDPTFDSSHVVNERIRIIVKMNISAQVFSSPMKNSR